ncbi:hypothetical protein N0V94_008847 [Neodidymelliopsis sp. IMI 364377]|nr:hypothetical protein N0V94_008847 [Neodidymelliopsis sp. IMI 364377]
MRFTPIYFEPCKLPPLNTALTTTFYKHDLRLRLFTVGGSNSKNAEVTAASIEEYYDSIAAWNRAAVASDCESNNESRAPTPASSDGRAAPRVEPHPDDTAPGIAPPNDTTSGGLQDDHRLAAETIRNMRVQPGNAGDAAEHVAAVLRALRERDNEGFDLAVEALKRHSVNISKLAKAALALVVKHPWKTAAIVIPFALAICTPLMLSILGFTGSGILAGSIAAGIQAGTGNVAAGSAFAVLTSAGMGGFGLAVVVGGVLVSSAALLWGIVLLVRWWCSEHEESGEDDDEGGSDGN